MLADLVTGADTIAIPTGKVVRAMSITILGSLGTSGVSQIPTLTYLEARLRSNQQQLATDEAIGAPRAQVEADKIAVQMDQTSIAQNKRISQTNYGVEEEQITKQRDSQQKSQNDQTMRNQQNGWSLLDTYL